ncbi:MAG TPA: hypothetical protein PL110_13410 [Candidatus Eremiobacteraeota bacterium]|nr:hypothetical protein [Candidatus Eremiobacteraeota bacterium]
MFNQDFNKIELYKANLYSPLAIVPPDGAVGFNYADTHKVTLLSGVWHVKGGSYGASHNEYLAYLLGKELNLPVPETVLYIIPEDIKYNYNTRLMMGKAFHSAQRYIVAELGRYFDYSSLSGENFEKLVRQIARMDIFDYITGNDDRHDKNFMINEKGDLFFIDNGYGGIGNEGIDFTCNRCIPAWIFQSPFYLEESISYQKKLTGLLPEKKVQEISLAMKEFDWKTWNCVYEGPYAVCQAPNDKTIDKFSQILLQRMETLADKPVIPFPLGNKLK